MRKRVPRWLVIGVLAVVSIALIPGLIWLSLTYQPSFYRAMVVLPPAQREVKAKQFMASSLQLRNDIMNEPTWEAIFSDQEVNAWLAEDLVSTFADQMPPGVHEPRVVFEAERVTLAFELDQGPLRSVIWVVARPHVTEPNVLELTFEKIRAGMVPVPADQVFDRVAQHARARGLDVTWRKDGSDPVATIRYRPNDGRADVKLERLQVRKGEIRLVGRSDRDRGLVRAPTLPTRKVLQSKFPRWKSQGIPDRPTPAELPAGPPASPEALPAPEPAPLPSAPAG